MLIGVYGDVHTTKNLRTLQHIWEPAVTKSILSMYDKFDERGVELAVCLGDFFDAPRLEAKHMKLVMNLLESMNNRTYPTYLLLGNHEIDSDESNILEYLNIYENIFPVTELTDIENLCFIPYSVNPEEVDTEGKIVFTHHDIYGSELASGATKAFFGLDPSIFSKAKLVMNGHVHLKSQVSKNVMNAGSLLTSQQGELRLGDFPSYYILDTKTAKYDEYPNQHSMIYLTIEEKDAKSTYPYDSNLLVLKVLYKDSIPNKFISAAHISWKKKLKAIDTPDVSINSTQNFDMKQYLVDYINNDNEVEESQKDKYINAGLRFLS